MTVAARCALTSSSFQQCSRTLSKGQAKRVIGRGPLIGYYLACPACGYAAPYLQDEYGFNEEPAPDRTWPRRILSIDKPPPCFGCRRLLVVVSSPDGDFLEAHDP